MTPHGYGIELERALKKYGRKFGEMVCRQSPWRFGEGGGGGKEPGRNVNSIY